jgi:hypothetical protein
LDRQPNETGAFVYLTLRNPPFPSRFALRSDISLIPSQLEGCTAEPYTLSMHTIVETPEYLRDARTAGLTDSERQAVGSYIASHPEAGDVILGTGGARKVRFAGRGKGKSGGYRVITFYTGPAFPVFLLNIFAKGEKINLTMAECNALRVILAEIVATYRKGVRRHDQGR